LSILLRYRNYIQVPRRRGINRRAELMHFPGTQRPIIDV
jgi:hypothetical protein